MQPSTPTLSWGGVNGATSYELQIATASTFASTVFDMSGITGVSQSAGLVNGTAYFWRVNASNANGTSAWSGIWNFKCIQQLPAVPTLASPTSGAIDQPISITLGWNLDSGAATYALQVSTASDLSTTVFSQTGIAGTSHIVGGLATTTLYYWRLNATNPAGTTDWSSIWSFTTTVAPGMPSLVSPSNGAVGQPIAAGLTWGAATTTTTYAVQVSTVSDFSTTVFAQAGITSLGTTTAALQNNTGYFWRANASGPGGTSAWTAGWSFTTIIASPTLSSPANNAINQMLTLTLSWGVVSGADSYTLQVATTSDFSTSLVNAAGLTVTSQTVGPLDYNVAYFWRVNDTSAGGVGGWSAVRKFTTTPPFPTLSQPSNGALGQPVTLSLSWTPVSGALSYGLQVSTASDFSTTVTSQSGITGS